MWDWFNIWVKIGFIILGNGNPIKSESAKYREIKS